MILENPPRVCFRIEVIVFRTAKITMAEVDGESEVQDQLDSLLSNLYDFGDDFVTSETNICKNHEPEQRSSEKESEVNKCDRDQFSILCSKQGKRNVSLFFDSIKDELCSQSQCTVVPCSSASKPNFEVVKFVSRRDHNQTKGTEEQDQESEVKFGARERAENEMFHLEKARLEVHKFGIRGYKKDKQRKFEQERAIMLGAKPLKREYVNYKVYQERKKELEQAQKERSFLENGPKPVKKKQKWDDRRTKNVKSAGILPSGQVGKFKRGALFLSGKDVWKITHSRVIKG